MLASCETSSGAVWSCQFQLVIHLWVIKPYIVFFPKHKGGLHPPPSLYLSQIRFHLKTCKKPGCAPCEAATASASPFAEWETVSVEQLLLPGPDGAAQLTGRWGGESRTKPLAQQPMGAQGGEGGSSHRCQDNHLWMSVLVECGQTAVI